MDATYGFLGTGKISSAVVTGYCTLPAEKRPRRILVSERSTEKSNALRNQFPDIVEIVASNEEIVRRSDVVFIGLLPGVASEVLPLMPWDSCKLVVSMMAAVNYARFLEMTGCPAAKCARIVPLPSSARHIGPILYHPANPEIHSLMQDIGTPVCCHQESEMIPLIAVTGHISHFYLLLNTSEQFLLSSGVSEAASRDFTASFYSSLATSAMQSPDSFRAMADHAATPGGLNEQSMRTLEGTDHYAVFQQSLEAIRQRLSPK